MSLEYNYLVTASFDSASWGMFDKCEGGASKADSTKYRRGGMGKNVSLGGPGDTENVKVTRLFVPEVDHANSKRLRARVGRAQAVVTKQPLDIDGNPFGQPEVYTGTVIGVETPDPDSNSNNPGLLQIEVECNEGIG